ncbi:alpha/beta-hydrolase [Cryphonectria parasitica EP155]|uniref:Alpha/beta-hydrolase n=1 Tax=Cryphonectria parasitica (strain ATCC 38755 / EP155) TaxID=660469 RepID=A0A9P4Y211_CRYP1|nr:alpha/beta-hydrolase [Cryphonectria parasitica EP155]KAF3765208.1 alpha/beta-hydrolase [Cryphonectria parasitica EP155]
MGVRHLRQRLFPDETNPTLIKTYPVRPRLPVRIFFPKSYDRTSPQQLPLLFSIHGGGFVLGEPSDNDPWNSSFSEKHKALVVALHYAKAPANHYPGPRVDLEALIAAVFADQELAAHINPDKVGITGFSAGGNLALTVSEVPAVRDRITAGVVPIYPVTDFATSPDAKRATRRYKPKLLGSRASEKDPLHGIAALFDWAYIPVGQDLRDPLLSPLYAERASLPRRIWVIGCELDMLGHEGLRTACRLAGKPEPGMDQRIGQEELAAGGALGTLITEGDERFTWEVKDQHGEVKWLCVPDAGHGFDMDGGLGADKEAAEDGRLKREALVERTGVWLFGES